MSFAFAESQQERDAPDAHWFAQREGKVEAQCSLWWSAAPSLPGERIGCIGHFAAESELATQSLLDRACRGLAARGCTLAVGPLDGNTLRRYRFITERGTAPPFVLEPDNPDYWPVWWEAAGFRPCAHYFSSLAENLTIEDPRLPKVRTRLDLAGVTMRPLDPSDISAELRRIYQVARVSFAQNYLASPFTEAAFLAQYLPLAERCLLEFCLLAEHAGQPVGFIFALPEPTQPGTILVKTFGVLPGRTYGGLGNCLLEQVHHAAHAAGFQRAIHALMYEGNNSLNVSGHTARVFRRYALFHRSCRG